MKMLSDRQNQVADRSSIFSIPAGAPISRVSLHECQCTRILFGEVQLHQGLGYWKGRLSIKTLQTSVLLAFISKEKLVSVNRRVVL
jgi:hypothetical protein